jgi:hypothetical protein
MSINRCDLCYELIVKPCQNSYVFDTGLPNTTHTMVLEDMHGNIFTEVNVPDGVSGEWTIHADQYPEGMFNEFSGTYEVYFTLGASGGIDGDLTPLTIDGTEYQCILIKVKNVTVVYD